MLLRILGKVSITLCAMMISASLSGCGGDRYQTGAVRGRLTMDGIPVAGADVFFLPVDAAEKTGRPAGEPGRGAAGTVGEDGSFTLTQAGMQPGSGVLVGPHRVLFRAPPTKRPRITAEERADLSPDEFKKLEEEYSRAPVYPPLPDGVTIKPAEVEVKPGENEFEFTLAK